MLKRSSSSIFLNYLGTVIKDYNNWKLKIIFQTLRVERNQVKSNEINGRAFLMVRSHFSEF